MKKQLLLLVASILIQTSFAQKLYTTTNYDKAIANNTRTITGIPGDKYWQNTSTYNINVKIDPIEGRLDAFQTINYTNNSPNELSSLCFNIYQNLYKKGVARRVEVAESDLHDGVKIENLMINNKLIDAKNISIAGTLMYIRLKDKLASKASITIQMNWSFKIPEKSLLRISKYSNESIFIGKWFPKLAVYDDIEGWNKYTHNGLAEFYNDYSDYQVAIEVPENYIVQATGELRNAEQVLHPQIYKRLQKAKNSDENIEIVSSSDKIVTKRGKQTWNFSAYNVPDFAFGIAKNYIWEASSIKSKSMTNSVFVDAIYPRDNKDFNEVISIAKQTIVYMSEEMPAVPYPYSHMSIYKGHGGMEYPMIVNDGSEEERDNTVYVTTHEIMHSIFPILVGMSETKYAWFDEGFTVVFPEELQDRLNSKANPAVKTVKYFESYYANNEREPVMMTPSHYLDANIYFALNYGKAEIAIRLFKEYLGKKAFSSLMASFINTWKSKHPVPNDFFAFTNDYLKTDLNWFWQKWFFEYAKADLSIKEVKLYENSYSIIIENIGGLSLPIEILIEYKDGSKEKISYKMDVWKTGEKALNINHRTNKEIKKIILGNKLIPDTNKENNIYNNSTL